MGVIDAAEQSHARLIFCDVNTQSASLFEMLGLTKHVRIATDETEALSWIEPQNNVAATAT
jgi:anti-anti-sigma regulatory factor